MSMNREQKRLLQRQGAVDADGNAVRTPRQASVAKAKDDRTAPAEFVREVRSELRKVAWPTRPEVINYSIIVLVTVAVLTAIVAGLDWVFATFSLWLYER